MARAATSARGVRAGARACARAPDPPCPPSPLLPPQKGFGPDGLGIVTVSGVPRFPELRGRLLPLAAALAGLPDAVKARLEDAGSNYNVGWSHGKEALEGGRPDLLKGSFYANPCRWGGGWRGWSAGGADGGRGQWPRQRPHAMGALTRSCLPLSPPRTWQGRVR
jgi:hypothetical protein